MTCDTKYFVNLKLKMKYVFLTSHLLKSTRSYNKLVAIQRLEMKKSSKYKIVYFSVKVKPFFREHGWQCPLRDHSLKMKFILQKMAIGHIC